MAERIKKESHMWSPKGDRDQTRKSEGSLVGRKTMPTTPDTPMTTMSQFIEPAPQKVSRRRSLSPKKPAFEPLKLVPEAYEDAEPARQHHIKSASEKKLFDMMTNPPEPPKSPKKKFMGITVPFLQDKSNASNSPSSSIGNTKAPAKAQQILGTSQISARPRALGNRHRSNSKATAPLPPNLSTLRSRLSDGSSICTGTSSADKGANPKLSFLERGGNGSRVVSDGAKTLADREEMMVKQVREMERLPRSQSMKAFLNNNHGGQFLDDQSLPPTPPAKNSPKDKVILQDSRKNVTVHNNGLVIDMDSSKGSPAFTDGGSMYEMIPPSKPTETQNHSDYAQFLRQARFHGASTTTQPAPSQHSDKETIDPPQFAASSNTSANSKRNSLKIEALCHPENSPAQARLSGPFNHPQAYYSPSIYSQASNFNLQHNAFVNQVPDFKFNGSPYQTLLRQHAVSPIKFDPETARSSSSTGSVPLIFQGPAANAMTAQAQPAQQDSENAKSSACNGSHKKSESGAPACSHNTHPPTFTNTGNVFPNTSNAFANAVADALRGSSPTKSFHTNNTGENFPHYPSLVPTPLFNREGQHGVPNGMPMAEPSLMQSEFTDGSGAVSMLSQGSNSIHMMPDGNNILTHFDVTNRHLMDQSNETRIQIGNAKEQVVNQIFRKHDESIKILNEQFGDIKEQLNGVEHNLGRLSGIQDDSVKNIEKILIEVKIELIKKLEQAVKQNADLTVIVGKLVERTTELEKQLALLTNHHQDDVRTPTQLAPAQTHAMRNNAFAQAAAAASQTSNAQSPHTTSPAQQQLGYLPHPYEGYSIPSYPIVQYSNNWGGFALPVRQNQFMAMSVDERRAMALALGEQMREDGSAPRMQDHPLMVQQAAALSARGGDGDGEYHSNGGGGQGQQHSVFGNGAVNGGGHPAFGNNGQMSGHGSAQQYHGLSNHSQGRGQDK